MNPMDSERDPAVTPLVVELPDGRTRRFSGPFYIGRDPECDVQIEDVHVSRRHAVVSPARGKWSIRDLQSSNGLLVDDERVETASIGEGLTVVLGLDGPSLQLYAETRSRKPPGVDAPPEDGSDDDTLREGSTSDASGDDSLLLEGYAKRYFDSGDEGEVGGRTQMIRRAFRKIQQKQKRQHRWVIGAVVLLALSAGGYAYSVRRKVIQLEAAARSMFYSMKAVDVSIAELQLQLAGSGSAESQQRMKILMDQRRQMESDYEQYVAKLYDRQLNEKDRLILRVTRMFGECDVDAPQDYVREVKYYIQIWQSTGRFVRAVKLAQDLGYTKRIAAEFVARDLPAQYFYLAMQESDFDRFAIGKPTRWGIAKGMWQFIPDTGRRFGLAIGPYAASSRTDALDERFDFDKATGAAASYIKDLYAKDTQASGLLVMASYNWGEQRVIDLVRKMPNTPTERNFWKLRENYRNRIPDETYNYVFSIVAGAVIGENPKLFGFPLDNPLGFLEQR
jgi:hypothetical protein